MTGSTPSRDSELATAAAKIMLDGRDPATDAARIMVTLEHLVALLLLVVMNQDHSRAAAMMNEGLAPGVEARLAIHAAQRMQP